MKGTVTLTTTLELQTCAACGITFGAPENFIDSRREDHQGYYCPNGHSLHFPQQTEAEKAQAEAARYKKLWREEQHYAAGVVQERNAAQKQLTKLKQRTANGVCPCCRRTFSNLQRHMQGQHPDYPKEQT